jgi:uncharacterized membrane protein YbhN (UPF0104 family)
LTQTPKTTNEQLDEDVAHLTAARQIRVPLSKENNPIHLSKLRKLREAANRQQEKMQLQNQEREKNHFLVKAGIGAFSLLAIAAGIYFLFFSGGEENNSSSNRPSGSVAPAPV